jgi:UDP-2,4-diacetamido-2,4,6-trideoxy-beta-L-altropyranose hydrolase
MRCLALAVELRRRGAEVLFVCRLMEGNLIDLVRQAGFDVRELPAGTGEVRTGPPHIAWLGEDLSVDAAQSLAAVQESGRFDWLIVDHYALDARWERDMRASAERILVIDDLADRDHDCEILLDQNLWPGAYERYAERVTTDCHLLLGPRFALLRPEFRDVRITHSPRVGLEPPAHLFIFLGAADPQDATSRVLDALSLLKAGTVTADVVVGAANPNRDRVRARCGRLHGVRYHQQVGNIAELMARADLAICSAGSITWERCALGLPAVALAIAENQQAIGEHSAGAGASIYLGRADDVPAASIARAIEKIVASPVELSRMRVAAGRLVDGAGAKRVAYAMCPRPLQISIVSDEGSWIEEYVEGLARSWRADGHDVERVSNVSQVREGDLAFFLGCSGIAGREVLNRNLHNLVVHESALPAGRGWAPLTWQILEGKNQIPVVLIEAEASVDAGDIYLRGTLHFRGFELCDELRAAQGEITQELCRTFVTQYPAILSAARPQTGETSVYRRRRPDDSRLDPESSIRQQFALLRVVDNLRYPAFFDLCGHRYVLHIRRLDEEPYDGIKMEVHRA